MTYLFLDTNVYIHYIDFEQIDWIKILGLDQTESISIVIPPIIIEEIDDLKDREISAKRKTKAKAVSSKIADYLINEKIGKFKVITCIEPLGNLFEDNQLDKSKNDNSFLLSAKQFKEEKGASVIIITRDNGVIIKAKRLNLAYYQIGSEYLLKEELTKEEKENAELKSRLAKYESRKSEPSIVFNNYKTLLELEINETKELENLIQEEVYKEKAKYPYWIANSNDEKASLNNSLFTNSNFVSIEKIKEYNDEIDEYIQEFESRIRLKLEFEYLLSNLLEIKLLLVNSGTAETGNLTIFLDFPNEIKLFNNENIRTKYLEPLVTPRAYPNSPDTRAYKKILEGIKLTQYLSANQTGDFYDKYKYWDLSEPAKNEYTIHEEKLTHGLATPLSLNGLRFDTRNRVNFSIKYRIHDTELPDPIEGVLSIVCKK